MIRKLALIAVALLATAAPARAGNTFVVLDGPATLPSAEVPNATGGIALPAAMSTSPLEPQQLSVAELTALWQRAGEAYGIPWEILAAINDIESNFGQNMGPSSAGAVGWMQFMPSTWERWGLDADGDGVANPWVAEDAIFAAARYLAAAGGGTDIERAVFAYNHADWYVRDVLQLAATYARGDIQAPFLIDTLTMNLELEQTRVAEAGAALAAAIREEERLAGAEARAVERVDGLALLSDSLLARKQATLI
ncbi:MAG: lytic transglycosylase domain-containing protein, partial [Actinomycetota bacterium]|nr:lytic transglycosylase domain-containing protein [Actinomycetota bacterium]